jgi:hypothetical protein
MTKIAVIIGGVLFLAGAALAGTFSSLGSSKTPTIGQAPAPVSSTTTTGRDDNGRENEAGEDLRGPCDEAEHANDPRCTGASSPRVDDDDDAGEAGEIGDDHGRENRGDRSGPSERSGHGGGDDGGHSGRGGGDDD